MSSQSKFKPRRRVVFGALGGLSTALLQVLLDVLLSVQLDRPWDALVVAAAGGISAYLAPRDAAEESIHQLKELGAQFHGESPDLIELIELIAKAIDAQDAPVIDAVDGPSGDTTNA